MASIVKYLKSEHNIINPPPFVVEQIQYECVMGSKAYGVSNDDSDMDIYGFCIPHKDMIFPHLSGYINGFGSQHQKFDQFQQHHIKDPSRDREYDITIYSIIKFFQLCMDNNPNIIDALFVPRRCVLYSSKISEMVREKRYAFLHKGAWHKFKGYAFSQMHKMKNKNPKGNRLQLVNQFGYDIKFGYHVVRLLNEIEQILTTGDLDLEKNREQLKSIRRGEWTQLRIEKYFASKEKDLEKLYLKSTLPYSPDEDKIKNLLLNCLEEHFGNLRGCVMRENNISKMIYDLESVISKYK